MNGRKEGSFQAGSHELMYMYVPYRVYELVLNIDSIERWMTCIHFHFIKVKIWTLLSHAVKVLTSRDISAVTYDVIPVFVASTN